MSIDVQATLAAVWRIESARIVGTVLRRVHDLGLAEELAQDAWVAALEHWPRDGLPDNPAAWLMTTAQRRALDWLRHRLMAQGHEDALAQDLVAMGTDHTPDHADSFDARRADALLGGDELLRLVFTACHPVLSPEARVALTLKVIGGLSTEEIARAFLVSEPTMAQRLVRAKRVLAEAKVACELPRPEALGERLAAVLEVVYLTFNEGYTATRGGDWMRPALCDEALRLGRMLAQLAADQAEVWGLLALMEIQASRTPARTDAQGLPILLAEQDRRRWDRLLIRRGLDALARAEALTAGPPAAPTASLEAGARDRGMAPALAAGGASARPAAGSYQLQAAIAAFHARAARVDDTDWRGIAALYGRLMQVAPSPVVELNRAVAVAQHAGPAAGLAIVDALQGDPALVRYPWLPAVRGDFLARLGRHAEARVALQAAATLTGNTREQALLLAKAAALPGGDSAG